ncbi:MAG: hypothetical protein KGL95_08105 [Patescibacteria group bacterium]|nr:hypothetical protein [Patescibacteria group bacterium]
MGRTPDQRTGGFDAFRDMAPHNHGNAPRPGAFSRRTGLKVAAAAAVALEELKFGVVRNAAGAVLRAIENPFSYNQDNPGYQPESIILSKTAIQVNGDLHLRKNPSADDPDGSTIISWNQVAAIGGKSIAGAHKVIVENVPIVRTDANGNWLRLTATDTFGNSGYIYVAEGQETQTLVGDIPGEQLVVVPVTDVTSSGVQYINAQEGTSVIATGNLSKVVQVVK